MSIVRNRLARGKIVAGACIALALGAPGALAADMAEDFDPGAAAGVRWAPAGWSVANNSVPLGSTDWYQGNATGSSPVFSSHAGVPDAYIAANFNSTTGGSGTISSWLITPRIETLTNGDTISFYTRRPTTPLGGTLYPDRLELRVSGNGGCSPGTGATSVGDFTSHLLSVNPDQTTGYPDVWTEYTATVRGVPAGAGGCIAFRYHVTQAGPTGTKSDYIGVDTFRFTEDVIAPPAPTIASLSPASPSNVASPAARGTAESDSTVRVYGDASCAGPELGRGPAADFAAGGVAFTAATDATTTPYATATDESDNVSPCSAAGPAYLHDGIAPETTDDLPAGWRNAPVPVTLTASDDGGTGVAATYYTIGADPAVPTTSSAAYDAASKPVLGDGEKIRYFSVDVAGNAEAPRTSAAARVDETAPVTTDDVAEGALPGHAVTLTASDAGSGVATTYYTVGADPAAPTTSSAVYDPANKPILRDGEKIRYLSVDGAGNAEAARTSRTVVAPPPPPPPTPPAPFDPNPGVETEQPKPQPERQPESGPGTPARKDSASSVKLAGGPLRATRGGVVGLRLGCSPLEGNGRGRCLGSVRLTRPLPARRGKRARARTIARATFTAGTGQSAAVRLRLTPAGRRLLAASPKRALRVRVVVEAKDLAGNRKLISWARLLRGR